MEEIKVEGRERYFRDYKGVYFRFVFEFKIIDYLVNIIVYVGLKLLWDGLFGIMWYSF